MMRPVNHVLLQAEPEAYVTDYVRRIRGNTPLTVTSLKRIVREALKPPLGAISIRPPA